MSVVPLAPVVHGVRGVPGVPGVSVVPAVPGVPVHYIVNRQLGAWRNMFCCCDPMNL